jgi:molecular chaperone HscB
MNNFFTLFNINQSPIVDKNDLRNKYFELQKKYHPDYSSDKTIDISLINEGYSVLSDQFLTILHILYLNGITIKNTNTNIDVLMQCMEWQENLQNKTNVLQTKKDINEKNNQLLNDIIELILNNKLTESVPLVEQMMYLQKII